MYKQIAALTFLLLWVPASFAHHSFSAEYNITELVTLKGEITSVEWVNPHVFITVVVKDSSGSLQGWRVEGGAVNVLKQSGWTPEMLRQMVKSHESVVIAGYRHRRDAASAGSAASQPVNVTGVITKVEWLNPRSTIYVDVKDPSTGRVSNFAFSESGASRGTFRIGTVVSVTGTMAPGTTNIGAASSVTLPDGRTLEFLGAVYSPSSNNGAWAKDIELSDGRKLPFN